MKLIIKNLGIMVSGIWMVQLFNKNDDDDDSNNDNYVKNDG